MRMTNEQKTKTKRRKMCGSIAHDIECFSKIIIRK